MDKTEHYHDDLKQCGLKSTRHRLDILAILDHSDEPYTADQVYLELIKRAVSINLSTVYRTLDTLAVNKLLNKLSISKDGRALYEYNRRIHRHYLVCLGCKRIKAIDGCPLEAYDKTLEETTNYTIAGHKLDIYGYCPQCKALGLPKQKH